MVAFRKLGVAAGVAVKETVAIFLITQGVKLIEAGDYLLGGGLVAAGWVLLLVQRII